MGAKITLALDAPSRIAHDVGLNRETELFLASEAARLMDPYVPKQFGDLKNQKKVEPGRVTYKMPYAQRQYYENSGPPAHSGPKRGKLWDQRMIADRREALTRAVQNWIRKGGK
jgi:hypothetical protein